MIADKYQRELRISANQHGKEKKLNYNSPLENQTWLKNRREKHNLCKQGNEDQDRKTPNTPNRSKSKNVTIPSIREHVAHNDCQ